MSGHVVYLPTAGRRMFRGLMMEGLRERERERLSETDAEQARLREAEYKVIGLFF